MKFHGPHRDIQLRRDFFIRPVAENAAQNLFLPGTQRSGAGSRPPGLQKLLCTGNQAPYERSLRRDKHFEVTRLLPPDKTLHCKNPSNVLGGKISRPTGFRTKLCHSSCLLTENK